MTSFGPADLYVVAFPDEHVPDGVREALHATIRGGAITVLDLAVVHRQPDGALDVVEIEALGDELAVGDLTGSGLIGEEDLTDVTGELPPGSSALVVLLENSWARTIAGAVRDAGGRVLAVDRFPAAVVNEVAQLAGIDANSS